MRIFIGFLIAILASLMGPADAGAQGNPESGGDFSRYTTPGQCVAAIDRLNRQYWRDQRPDTLSFGPETDSIPAGVLHLGGQCADRFSIQTIPQGELYNLARLYWSLGDDTRAREAIDKLLSSPGLQDPEERGWILTRIVGALISVKPARTSLAKHYMEQLEALGKTAAPYRMFANMYLLSFTTQLGQADTALKFADHAKTATREMSEGDRLDYAFTIMDVYDLTAEPLAVEKGSSAAVALLDTAAEDVLPLRPVDSRDHQRMRSIISARRMMYGTVGDAAARLTSDKWFNLQPGDSVLPATGVPTLIYLGSHACGGSCYTSYASLRRLHDKYQERGLKIVILGMTGGFYRNRLLQPTAEVDSAGRYYTDFLNLPAIISMNETEFVKIHDGRRRNNPPVNFRNYSRGRNAVLVGPDGKIMMFVQLGPARERLMEKVLDSFF